MDGCVRGGSRPRAACDASARMAAVMRTVGGGHDLLAGEGAGGTGRCWLLRAAWAVAGLVTLLAVLVAVEAQADRRRQWTTYGSARDRDRLVVECDMRSATCSDGRRITTTRSTSVPCEVEPGVWVMVGPNEGCYSVRGLESWEANTTFLSWGAELDRSSWRAVDGATLTKQDGFYRISGVDALSRVLQSIVFAGPGDWTLSCIMRTAGSQNPRLRIYQEGASGGGFCNLDSSDAFSTYSCTQTITGPPTQMSIHVYSGIGHIDVQGCWLTRTSTPGRACWGGEAYFTCDVDLHTISAEGWPTEAGEVSLVYTPGQVESVPRYLISASEIGIKGWDFLVSFDDTMTFFVHSEVPDFYSSDPLTWEPRPYELRVRWGDGIVSFWRDGVLVGTRTMTQAPKGVPSTALIGSAGGVLNANGSISSLRVRSLK